MILRPTTTARGTASRFLLQSVGERTSSTPKRVPKALVPSLQQSWISGCRHSEPGYPRWNRLVEAVVHVVVATGGQRRICGDPGANLTGGAAALLAHPIYAPRIELRELTFREQIQ